MASLVRPRRTALFSKAPKAQVAADLLDAQIHNLIEAVYSTQVALEDIRRDDGKIKSQLIGPEQMSDDLVAHLVAGIQKHTSQQAFRAEHGASQAINAEQNTALFARDAEAAAISASQFLAAVNTAAEIVKNSEITVDSHLTAVEAEATDAENWATYSKAQADNAIAAKNEATQWAEYLAGPVVNPNDAPAYIQDHPFGHGLYYQPVEGYGGTGGLWSAKWWAVYAAQLVGPWSFYYLGGWADPPLPGAVHPDTGIKIPDPLPPGSFYYDTDTDTVYFWNGSEWVSPYSLASGVTSRFVYKATAGQTVFSGPDFNGATPAVGQSPSDVHLNGVKLVPTLDYTVNTATSTLTLLIPSTVDSYVQWDLLVPSDKLTPSGVHSFKCALTGAIDGANKDFTLQYTHPVNGPQPTTVTDSAQLQVSLDGIVQEPGIDYTASAAALSFVTPPLQGAHLWVVWFATAVTLS
jgi:hypothetical protein